MDETLPFHPFQVILDYYPELKGQKPYVIRVWEDNYTCDVVWEDQDGKLTETTAGEYCVMKSSVKLRWASDG